MGALHKNSDAKQSDWDFRGADTKQYTHCFHTYPAMMIPQIARKLIAKYGEIGGILFDPYCGTGTSLVEARLAGMNAIGTDINPAARMIAKSKSDDYNMERLSVDCQRFLRIFTKLLETELPPPDINPDTIDFSNLKPNACLTWEQLERWFPKRSILEVCFAIQCISTIRNSKSRQFIKIALSECLRLISFQRNSEFKLYRIEKDKRNELFHKKLLPLIKERLARNLKGLTDFKLEVDPGTYAKVKQFNTVHSLPSDYNKPFAKLVLTSPPYGDSSTTVAYAQFSWLTNTWLELDKRTASALDRELMGGKRGYISRFGFKKLDAIIEDISNIEGGEARAEEVWHFFSEYQDSIHNVCKTIVDKGIACYVVGNRTVKGFELPTAQFTEWVFKCNGFSHIETIERNIPNKRMPSKNSPTNVSGVKSTTMMKEYIIICEKVPKPEKYVNQFKDENQSKEEFIRRYKSVREMGWVKTMRKGSTGVGATLEYYMKISENNKAEPDLGPIEIKSQRQLTNSKITLSSLKPSHPKKANTWLREEFGIPNGVLEGVNKLHATISAKWNPRGVYDKWKMRLYNDNEARKILIQIKDIESNQVVKTDCWYDYEELEKMVAKCYLTAFVTAEKKTEKDVEYFHYDSKCKLYFGATFQKFLDLVEKGIIVYDIRIGYHSNVEKSNYGKPHDHGSGWRIERKDLHRLFEGDVQIDTEA